MNKLATYFYASKAYQSISLQLQKTLLGSHKVSMHRLLQIFFSQMRKDHIFERASAMAFNFVLSIFPAIIFIFTLIPMVPIPDLQEKIMTALKNLLPLSIYNGAAAAIYDIIHIPHGGLMSFGFLFAVFTATNGIMAMISAFNKCYKTVEKRGYIKKVSTAITIVFFLLVIVFISIFLAVLSKQYIQKIDLNKEFLYYLIIGFKNLLFFMVFLIGISIIYYVAPAITVRWKFFSIGSIIASLLSVFLPSGFLFM
jgi:membrane protein